MAVRKQLRVIHGLHLEAPDLIDVSPASSCWSPFLPRLLQHTLPRTGCSQAHGMLGVHGAQEERSWDHRPKTHKNALWP